MESYPQNDYLLDRERVAREDLLRVQGERSAFSFHSSLSHWIAKADRMNNDFFSTFRARPPGSSLRSLRDSAGSLHTAPDTVMQMATDYYRTFFTAEPLTQNILHARRLVLQTMHASVTSSMSLILDTPFTERELQHAVAAIDASSCPGDDGLTKFFFTEFWDVHCYWAFSMFLIQDTCHLL